MLKFFSVFSIPFFMLSLAFAEAVVEKTGTVFGPKLRWIVELENDLESLEKAYPGQLGVYIKRLSDESVFSYRGDQLFFLSGGAKLPVAIEVFRQIDTKKINLETKLTLSAEDYVDGKGDTNLHSPGSKLTIGFLLQQMIVKNDNTANDVLIKQVGVEPINNYLKEIVPSGFEKIMSTADSRRLMYSEIHPSASTLKSNDLMALNIDDDIQKMEKFREILKLKESELLCRSMNQAMEKYYKTNLNSATLQSYARLLEQLAAGDILSSTSQMHLLSLMKKSEGGQERIIAGLPKDIQYANRSGSQKTRLCDFGIAWKGSRPQRKNSVVVVMCVRDFKSVELAEAAFRRIATTLTTSEIFN